MNSLDCDPDTKTEESLQVWGTSQDLRWQKLGLGQEENSSKKK